MNIDFNKGSGLIPVIVQDYDTLQVLMLGYMNEEALIKTNEDRVVTFFSRSKNRLWTKGETSGNTLVVKDIFIDCDNDTLLIKAQPNGPTCHKGNTSCFDDNTKKGFLYKLESIINKRIEQEVGESYTNRLFKEGINKVAQKVGEEAVELIIEAKDDNIDLFKNEAADLMYHLLILLRSKNITLEQVELVLRNRQ